MKENQNIKPRATYHNIAHDFPIALEGLEERLSSLSSHPWLSEKFLRNKAKEYALELLVMKERAKLLYSYVRYLEAALVEKGGSL